ncbi:uncharacterized protein CPUR_02155 [Claviceps purpurea 20.1]|uniref:Uncharacterized protein n=1 Tax=Claviceps purpurea (strain 20.1) TaxID=1111077 RepID=M1W7I2_CLAP2|nr:uncharacterized protein CPUR_02155 [Claviceps purpurea 20.1]
MDTTSLDSDTEGFSSFGSDIEGLSSFGSDIEGLSSFDSDIEGLSSFDSDIEGLSSFDSDIEGLSSFDSDIEGLSSFDSDIEGLSYETDSGESNSSELSHPWGSSELAPSYEAAADYALKLLNSQGTIFEDTFRLSKGIFYRLLQWLQANNEGFIDTPYRSCAQRLMVFLYIMASGETQRNTAHRFRMSQPSVCRIFHKVLSFMVELHVAFVKMPGETYVSDKISTQDRFSDFIGCIGAIDGTHIAAHVPEHLQRRFRSRKGGISHNVLAAVTFSGRFIYVLGGAEGSIGDATLIRIASTMDFQIPKGRFLLGDAGFGNTRRGLVCPYANTRYHLQEYRELDVRPETPEELYNLRHSSARVIVEQAFGRLKRRWAILRTGPPEYSILDQTRIIYAATALQNFDLMDGLEPEDYIEKEEDAFSDYEKLEREQLLALADLWIGDKIGKDLRDEIANAVWANYVEYWRNQADSENGESDTESSDSDA